MHILVQSDYDCNAFAQSEPNLSLWLQALGFWEADIEEQGGKDSAASGIGADGRDLARGLPSSAWPAIRSQASIVFNYIRSYFTEIPRMRERAHRLCLEPNTRLRIEQQTLAFLGIAFAKSKPPLKADIQRCSLLTALKASLLTVGLHLPTLQFCNLF
jgi:hypothetical protein